ncbi:MAG: hypothetical protein WBP81_24250, partial [Solirubrobacteraceae bacterium]
GGLIDEEQSEPGGSDFRIVAVGALSTRLLLSVKSGRGAGMTASGVKQQRARGRRSPGPPGPNHARRGCLRKRVFLHTVGRALVSAKSNDGWAMSSRERVSLYLYER